VDGANGVGGVYFLAAGCDGGGDLKSVQHEAGAAAVDGFVVETSHHLPDGEEDRGGVFKGRYLGRLPLVQAVDLHVEEAIRFAIHGRSMAAQSIVLDMAALSKHDDSPLEAAGRFAGKPPPPGGVIMFSMVYGQRWL
jgi:hypothetical protein